MTHDPFCIVATDVVMSTVGGHPVEFSLPCICTIITAVRRDERLKAIRVAGDAA